MLRLRMANPSPAFPSPDIFFAAIVNSSGDAIISKDLTGVITSWNKAAERIFGYASAEMIGQPITILIPPELQHEEALILSRIRSGEVIKHYETYRRRKDGQLLDISLTISPIYDASGTIVGVSKIARDVSNQKREQEKFRVTLSSIGDAVISTDVNGRIVFMNTIAQCLTCWSDVEALGRPIEEIFRILSQTTRQPVDSPVAAVLRTGSRMGLASQTILLDRQNRERPIDDSAAPIWDSRGQLIGVVLVFRDDTERRKAEMAAVQLAAIVEGSDDAIISKNLNGVVTSWNPAAARIFGFTAEEMIGQPITRLIPVERLDEEQLILRRLQRGERVEHFQTVRQRKDGQKIHVSLTISPIRNKDGLIVGASKIARDITELKAAQEKLENHAAELESKIKERTGKLNETVAELEAFSYTLSHDMRAPLRSIQSFCELVIEDHGPKIPEALSYLRRTIESAQRLDRLVQEILDLTKSTRGEIFLGPIDLDELVQCAVRERPDVGTNKVRIDVLHPLSPVMGHSALLTQCITNLLDNAIKFVSAGRQPSVRIYTETAGDRVRLCFTDNGIGISSADQPALFEMFQRLPAAKNYRGTGLGLAIVKRAAARMDGTVAVQSLPGQGSTFWIELPKPS